MEIEQLMDEIDLIPSAFRSKYTVDVSQWYSNEYLTFYIKDYALYTETEKNSLVMKGIEHKFFVHITLGGDKQSDNYLEIVGKAGLVADREIIDWLSLQKGLGAVEADMVMLRIMVLKVKLVGE